MSNVYIIYSTWDHIRLNLTQNMINHHCDSIKKSQNKINKKLRLEKYCSYTVFIQIKAGLILTPGLK